MSVYSLAVPVPVHHLRNQDTDGIQLPANPKVWGTELMWSTLRSMPSISTEPWIVGGDLNASVRFDERKDRGNQMILDRMADIGLPNIVRGANGSPVPTFRHSFGGLVDQLDYLFANRFLLDRLTRVEVFPDVDRVFGQRPMLSDHLPIIADFDIDQPMQ